MTLALALFVSAAALLLAKGFQMLRLPGMASTFATGAASGVFNGGFGMGGPPVVLFFFSSPTGAAAGRASLIAYFLMTDLMGVGVAGVGRPAHRCGRVACVGVPAASHRRRVVGESRLQTGRSGRRTSVILRTLMLLAVLAGARAVMELR